MNSLLKQQAGAEVCFTDMHACMHSLLENPPVVRWPQDLVSKLTNWPVQVLSIRKTGPLLQIPCFGKNLKANETRDSSVGAVLGYKPQTLSKWSQSAAAEAQAPFHLLCKETLLYSSVSSPGLIAIAKGSQK